MHAQCISSVTFLFYICWNPHFTTLPKIPSDTRSQVVNRDPPVPTLVFLFSIDVHLLPYNNWYALMLPIVKLLTSIQKYEHVSHTALFCAFVDSEWIRKSIRGWLLCTIWRMCKCHWQQLIQVVRSYYSHWSIDFSITDTQMAIWCFESILTKLGL